MNNFKGKVVFATGGAGGIGYGLAEGLYKEGCKVILADIDEKQLEKAKASFPGECLTVVLDVTDRDSWAAAKEKALAEYGQVDILLNVAGIMRNPLLPHDKQGILDCTPKDWDKMIGINLTGMYNGVITFGPEMRERGEGYILNTSSTQGLIPTAWVGSYSASKFAVTAMTEALHDELEGCGISVSVLFPGVTQSRLAINAVKDAGIQIDEDKMKMPGMTLEECAKRTIRAMKRNDLYIITHGEYAPYCRERFDKIMGAFADCPPSPEYDPSKPLPGTREWANGNR